MRNKIFVFLLIVCCATIIVGCNNQDNIPIWPFVESQMNIPRKFPKVILLNNGKVLIINGWNYDNFFVTKAEICTPNDNGECSFEIIGDTKDFYGTPFARKDGKIIIIGNPAQLFDPDTNVFTDISSPFIGQYEYLGVIQLNDGRIFIPIQKMIYNPDNDTKEILDSSLPPSYHWPTVYTLLPDGRVFACAESNERVYGYIYDLSAKTCTQAGFMNNLNYCEEAILMENGKVLVCGYGENPLKQDLPLEIFDPATGQFIVSKVIIPYIQSMTNLLNGNVLITALGKVYIYSPQKDDVISVMKMHNSRLGYDAVTRLSNGNVLFVGCGEPPSTAVVVYQYAP